jgi:hypothetical protein
LAVAQAELLHGIHLPGVVREHGTGRIRRRPTARWGRGLLLLQEPALQGPLAGQEGRIGAGGQAHADVTSAPGRVLLTQRQGGGVERVAIRAASRARPVAGFEAVGLGGEALQQLPHRPLAQVQVQGDGDGIVAAARPAQDELAKREGEWRRHGNPRRSDAGMTIAYSPAAARQNLCVGISGITYCRVTAPRSPQQGRWINPWRG